MCDFVIQYISDNQALFENFLKKIKDKTYVDVFDYSKTFTFLSSEFEQTLQKLSDKEVKQLFDQAVKKNNSVLKHFLGFYIIFDRCSIVADKRENDIKFFVE